MEDAATAEISRSQIWQWIHTDRHGRGRTVTREWVEGCWTRSSQLERFEGDRFDDALEVFAECALAEEFPAS